MGSQQLTAHTADYILVSFGNGCIAQYDGMRTVIRTVGYHTSQSTLDEDGQPCVVCGAQGFITTVVPC
jgi:predicted transcriptional regulator